MTGIGLLNGVDGQGANSVDAKLIDGIGVWLGSVTRCRT
jgi:hypothetical protein